MAFEITLQAPTKETKGVVAFYRDYPAAKQVLEAWAAGAFPTQAQLDALLTVILFFVPDEQKEQTRARLIETASFDDVFLIVNSLPQLLAQ